MSTAITDINARHREDFEKLLAASSKIIQLETLVEAANALIKAKDVQIEALKAICEATVGMLTAARPLFPDDLVPRLDRLLLKAGIVIALVKT